MLDALYYAPGPIVRRVELSGKIIEDYDKACASRRRELWRFDATDILHEFARWCAIGAVIGYWPDAPEVACQWLATGDESLRVTAYATARAAARAAAREAAWNAAQEAVWAAAQNPAWVAACAAARNTADAAARDIAYAATQDAMNSKLEEMIFNTKEAQHGS